LIISRKWLSIEHAFAIIWGDDEITEIEYYLKEIKVPVNPIAPPPKYTVSLILVDDNQLLVKDLNDAKTGKTTELLKDLCSDFPYVQRNNVPKKEQIECCFMNLFCMNRYNGEKISL
jgi:predicted transcriptional regulators